MISIKAVENPVMKPLNEWRDELYGYWMVYSDRQLNNGVETVIARHYGTDKEKLYSLYDEMHAVADDPTTVGILFNKRGNNWMGGVFLVKTES